MKPRMNAEHPAGAPADAPGPAPALDPASAPAGAPVGERPWPALDAPYLTADIPPIGGRLKERIEDFVVEEIPLYRPSGAGEHIYLFIEKHNMSTSQLVAIVARHFGVPKNAVGFAGMKDKFAITRQVISVHTPGMGLEDFPMLTHERLAVLWADLHTNKLRLGHLASNRFSVRIRGVEMGKAIAARAVLRALERAGVPNFAGEQRFGNRQNNHRLGRLMLLGRDRALLDELLGPDPAYPALNAQGREHYALGRFAEAHAVFPSVCRHELAALAALKRGGTARHAIQAIDVFQRRFWFSAFQSAVFNAVLAQRLRDGTLATLEAGDVAAKHENTAMFRVDDAVLAEAGTAGRLERLEISPSGPMWGRDMMTALGAPAEREAQALAQTGVTVDHLAKIVAPLGPSMTLGARRALRVPIMYPEVEGGLDAHGPYVRCAFELPPGSFATVVMREIMKTGIALDDGPDGDAPEAPAPSPTDAEAPA